MAEGWRVTGQLQQTGLGPGGLMRPVMRVDYASDDGTIAGWVECPMPDYTADNVRKLIEDDLAKHRAVRAL
jgi:hypothetical protein